MFPQSKDQKKKENVDEGQVSRGFFFGSLSKLTAFWGIGLNFHDIVCV